MRGEGGLGGGGKISSLSHSLPVGTVLETVFAKRIELSKKQKEDLLLLENI